MLRKIKAYLFGESLPLYYRNSNTTWNGLHIKEPMVLDSQPTFNEFFQNIDKLLYPEFYISKEDKRESFTI